MCPFPVLVAEQYFRELTKLSHLQQFPIDVLKVDRSFASGLEHGSDYRSSTKAIVAMVHSLEMMIVAEGVETDSQLRVVRHLSVDRVHGYLISKSIPGRELRAFLDHWE